MDALEKLQGSLRTVNRVALSRLRPGDALQMRKEQERLRAWVKGAFELESVPLITIDRALQNYRQNRYLQGLRQVRLVCFGCTQGSEPLIEDSELFEKLLGYVDRYKDRRRTFRKLYRALLSGYFSYDPDSAEGHRSREMLRLFLAGHLSSFVIGEFTPDWLLVLARYPNLLGEHPGQTLEASMLRGDWSVFDEICKRLELDGGSWLVRQLVITPVMAIERMDDAAFIDHLDSILLLLNEYPLFASDGLQILLDRYVRCKQKPVHVQLRDFAVGLWGNPWLHDTVFKWKCGEKAREMLSHWLRRRLLREFFFLLSNDDKAHPRRWNFWELYSEDMTGMYFALGQDAYVGGNMALYKFRSHAKGLVARLTDEKYGVHTCIMQFKNHHVVELNHENNMAYFYDVREGIPSFYFAKGWVDIGAISVNDVAQGIDVARTSKPLRHEDNRRSIWEGRFAEELGMTAHAMAAFCRKYQCVYENSHDGSERVRPVSTNQYGAEVWSVLKGWGFTQQGNDWLRLTYPSLI